MNKKKDVNFLVCGAVIAALYAALTYAASAVNLAYGAVQFRFSEALTVLAAYHTGRNTRAYNRLSLGKPRKSVRYYGYNMRLGSNAFGCRIYVSHEKGQGKGAAASRTGFFGSVQRRYSRGGNSRIFARGLYVQGLSYTGSICRSRRARGMLRRRNAALRSNKQNGTS